MNIKDLEIIKSMQNNKGKTALWIACAILLVVVGIILVRKFKGLSGLISDKANEAKLIEEANKNMIGDDVTLTQEEFGNLAKRLYRAMKGRGTDEDAIWDVYERLSTRSDVLQLNKTFGIMEDETLAEWLYDDLEADEILHLNQILANKGINYQY